MIQTIPSNDFGGSLQWTGSLWGPDHLVLGTDGRTIIAQTTDDLFSSSGSTGQTLARGQQLGWGLFGEWILPATEGLTVIPSLRADWWKNFNARSASLTNTTAFEDNTVSVVNPKLSVNYVLTDRVRAGASAYQGFRAPTINELYRGFAFAGFSFLPNDQLRPERLTGAEVKLEGELFDDRALRWRLSVHRDEVKDQILFLSQGPLAAQRQNVGKALSTGGALDLSYRVSPILSLTLGYAYVDSTITSLPGAQDREGKRIPNVSRNQVTVGMTGGRADWVEVTIMARYLSRQFTDDLNTQSVADFVVLDASLQRQLRKGLRLVLNGENLTDRHYIATQTGPVKTLGSPLLIMGGIRAEY